MNAFLSSMTGSKPKKSALESAVAKLKEGKRLDEISARSPASPRDRDDTIL